MTTEPLPEPPSVFVQFFGICTHISPVALTPPATDWTHRVVLVNASHPQDLAEPRLHDLEPHLATLQIEEPYILKSSAAASSDVQVQIINLNGVTMTITNAVPKPTDVTPTPCMPSLSDYVRPDFLPLHVSRHVYEKNPADTACFFDFINATPLTSYRYGEAAFGVLQVFTSGDPVLEITPFDANLPSTTITLKTGAYISVCNLPAVDTKDSVDDFLLHYLVVDPFPSEKDLRRPLHFDVKCTPLTPQNGPLSTSSITTAGCSNSNYP